MSSSQSEAGPSTLATPRLPARAPPRSDHDKLVEILAFIQSLGLSFPRFLNLMFTVEPKGQGNKVLNTTNTFLNQSNKPIYIDDILTRIYEHRFSAPKPSRPGGGNIGQVSDTVNSNNWARHRMQKWAIDLVSSLCTKEAEALMSTKDNPLRTTQKALSWAILNGWKADQLRRYIEVHAPTIWRLFEVIARRGSETAVERAEGASTTRIQASRLVRNVFICYSERTHRTECLA